MLRMGTSIRTLLVSGEEIMTANKMIWVLPLLLTGLCLLTACGYKGKDKAQFDRAENLLSQNKYENALQEYTSLTREFPKSGLVEKANMRIKECEETITKAKEQGRKREKSSLEREILQQYRMLFSAKKRMDEYAHQAAQVPIGDYAAFNSAPSGEDEYEMGKRAYCKLPPLYIQRYGQPDWKKFRVQNNLPDCQ